MGLKRFAAAVVGAVLLLGCTSGGGDRQDLPVSSAPTTSVSAAIPRPADEPVLVEEPSDAVSSPELSAMPSNPVAEGPLECEPLTQDFLDRIRLEYGTPDRAIQVEVGEGLTPGEVWWVVVLDSPADQDHDWADLRLFLTNAQGVEARHPLSLEGTKWIPLPPEGPWTNVGWEPERLERGQAALAKAQGCV